MKHLDPDYELVSRRSTSRFSQAPDQLGYIALVSQNDCYMALLRRLCPTAPLVKPAFKQGVFRPHYLSVLPFENWSFRVRGRYYDEWRGQVDNIHYQSKLIGLRGNVPTYKHYLQGEIQITDDAVAFVFHSPGTIKPLV